MAQFADLTYTAQVMALVKKPKNLGQIKNPDGVGLVGNPVCGDIMKIFIKVGKRGREKTEYIKNIKFQTLGCGAAIATSSLLTVLAKNKTLEQAKRLSAPKLISKLGGLPESKIHCSVLADQALKKAIADYHSKTLI